MSTETAHALQENRLGTIYAADIYQKLISLRPAQIENFRSLYSGLTPHSGPHHEECSLSFSTNEDDHLLIPTKTHIYWAMIIYYFTLYLEMNNNMSAKI